MYRTVTNACLTLVAIVVVALSALPVAAYPHGGGGGGGGFSGGSGFSGGRGFSGSSGMGAESHSFSSGSGQQGAHFGNSGISGGAGQFMSGKSNFSPNANVSHWQNNMNPQVFSYNKANNWSNWNHGDWNHGNWNHGNWYYHQNFAFVFAPFWFPNWYGYYGYYPGGYFYYNDYGPYAADPGYAAAPQQEVALADPPGPEQPGGDQAVSEVGQQFYDNALAAFREGAYRDAVRLANHAAVEMPQDPRVHRLMSLGLFAAGDYRGAAIEGHAAVALGGVSDWPTVYGIYANADPYTTQLRALETYVKDKPSSPEAQFLLGYHYLMLGHKDTAKEHLTKAVSLTPADPLAQKLLKEAGGEPPTTGSPPPPPQPDSRAKVGVDS